MLPDSLKEFEGSFSGYTELRAQENRNTRIVLLNGDVISNTKITTSGTSARVCSSGLWGFASNPAWNSDSVKSVIRSASRNAEFMHKKKGGKEINVTHTAGNFTRDYTTRKNRASQKELIDFCKCLDDYIVNKYPKLQSRSVILAGLDMEKRLLTSFGSESYSMVPRSNIIVRMSVEGSDGPCELYNVYGGLGQFEDMFTAVEALYPEIDRLYEQLMSKNEGVYAKAGEKTVVLGSDLAGILAHEAIGHTTEADIVLGGSIAKELLNQEVASPLVTLVDFAHSYDGKTLPVPVYMDDEGTTCEDTVIIQEGVLKTFMHNRESAEHFGHKATGHARAYQFSDEPLIRMRNTGILPGKSKLEDMISSVEDGYYLTRQSNGQADSTSEFMFGVPLGYEIKNGKLGKAIKDTTISGVAFDVLKTVTMVGDEMTWGNAGMCGKKQLIPVGMGGPAIKCKLNIGGR